MVSLDMTPKVPTSFIITSRSLPISFTEILKVLCALTSSTLILCVAVATLSPPLSAEICNDLRASPVRPVAFVKTKSWPDIGAVAFRNRMPIGPISSAIFMNSFIAAAAPARPYPNTRPRRRPESLN